MTWSWPSPRASSRGSTQSRHIGRISRGGPGSATMTRPPGASTHQPGAVPFGLGIGVADGSSQACLRFIVGNSIPRRVQRPRSHSSSAGSTLGSSPTAAAMASRVRSSGVGPRPPVEMTTSDRLRPFSKASLTTSRRSGTAVRRPIRTPRWASSRAISPAFVSRVSPTVSSVPIESSSAVRRGLATVGRGASLGGAARFGVRARAAAPRSLLAAGSVMSGRVPHGLPRNEPQRGGALGGPAPGRPVGRCYHPGPSVDLPGGDPWTICRIPDRPPRATRRPVPQDRRTRDPGLRLRPHRAGRRACDSRSVRRAPPSWRWYAPMSSSPRPSSATSSTRSSAWRSLPASPSARCSSSVCSCRSAGRCSSGSGSSARSAGGSSLARSLPSPWQSWPWRRSSVSPARRSPGPSARR